MPEPTGFEQEVMELLNHARLDPTGITDVLIVDAASQTGATSSITSALRFFNVDVAAYEAQIAQLAPQAPMGWDDRLATAAGKHSELMRVQDEQSHRLDGEASLGDRIRAEGYSFNRVAENVYAYAVDPLHTFAGFYIDWGYDDVDFSGNSLRSDWQSRGDGIQDPAGHRDSMMSSNYVDLGIAALADSDPNTQVGPNLVTMNMGRLFTNPVKILGVVYSDDNADGRYNSGEGISGTSFTASGGAQAGWSSGGYQLVSSQETGPASLTGSIPGLGQPVSVTLDMQGENVKLDFVETSSGWEMQSSASLTITATSGTPITRAVLLGGQDLDLTAAQDTGAHLTGNSGDNVLAGQGSGQDSLYGMEGADTLTAVAGDDRLYGGAGDDSLDGGAGNDTVNGGHGDDRAHLGQGDDLYQSVSGADTVQAGQGDDTLTGAGGAEELRGEDGDDSVIGNSGDDLIFGGSGFDTLRGGTGADTIHGGNGRDLTYLGEGNDLFVDTGQGGVNGRDTVWANGGDDTIGGGNGDDLFHGQSGADKLLGRLGNDTLYGGDQNDTLNGGDGDDVAYGGNGRDKAYLGNGDDQWFDNTQVQFGDDLAVGGNGNDTLHSAAGEDTLTGGSGADHFVFAATMGDASITDFTLEEDRLELASSLWTGSFDQTALEARTQVSAGSLELSLDGGAVLTLEGITSTQGLLMDIELV